MLLWKNVFLACALHAASSPGKRACDDFFRTEKFLRRRVGEAAALCDAKRGLGVFLYGDAPARRFSEAFCLNAARRQNESCRAGA